MLTLRQIRQQFAVAIDHDCYNELRHYIECKQLYPSVTTFNDECHIQYNLSNNHIMFVVTDCI